MKNQILIFLSSIYLFSSCLPKPEDLLQTQNTSTSSIENLTISPNFNFKTSDKITIKVSISNGQDKALKSIPFSIYTDPTNELLVSGMTNQNGEFEVVKELGNHIKQLSFKTDFIGIPNSLTIKIENQKATFLIGGSKPMVGYIEDNRNARIEEVESPLDLSFKNLGTWSSVGVPTYLEKTNESISTEFLQDITASLPESKTLTSSHPDYLKGDKPTTLYIKEKADVWVTFVHEGAGWQNSLGFYTFDANNPPTKVSDLQNLTMIFPNVSYSGSGGGLVSGNKVKIGTFDAGTSVGFFMIANAFANGKVGGGYYAHFSHSNLNVESVTDLRRHFVILDDSKSNRMLLAVEDVSRENKPIGCDNDFNDAVFFVTSNPVAAIENPSIPKMDTFKDTDGDGVGDTRDEFPTDAKRAFSSYTPSKTTFGSLAYEDLWPSKGDYDFNDLVLNYQFQEVYDANNQVVEVKLKTVVKAVGASFKNGWGFELPIAPSAIKKVSGQSIKSNYVSLSANGTETGQSKAVIMVFDDAFNQIKRVGADFVNTMANQPYSQGDTLNVLVELNSPISSLGTAPYNPFLVVNQERGKEVHLPNNKPTDKADTKLFGTSHDRSQPSKNIYYKNWKNLPWVLHLPVNFDYPYEKIEVINSYYYFQKWAESSGSQYSDWYLDKSGYRNAKGIYKK